MVLKVDESISFQNVQNEFGGNHPIAINEYYNKDNQDENLLSQFKFDNNTLDSTPYNNPLTLGTSTALDFQNNIKGTSSLKTSAGTYSGTNDGSKIMLTNPLYTTSTLAFSFSFWVKLYSSVSTTGQGNTLLNFTNTTYIEHIFTIDQPSNPGSHWRFIIDYPSQSKTVLLSNLSFKPTSTDTWYHLTINLSKTSDGKTKYEIYNNGILQEYDDTTFNWFSAYTISQINIASFANTTNIGKRGTPCYINDFRVYNKTLTQQEVLDVMNNYSYFYRKNVDLIAWYKFDNGFIDNSNNGRNLIPSNNTVVTITGQKKVGTHSLYTPGVTATIPNVNLSNCTFSVAAWCRPTSSTQNNWLLINGNSNTTNNKLTLGLRGSGAYALAFWGNDLNTSASYLSDVNQWTHLTYIVEKTTTGSFNRYIYRNGILIGNNTTSSYLNVVNCPVLGKDPSYTSLIYTGYIDDFRLYNKALTKDEIEDIIMETKMDLKANIIYHYEQRRTATNTYVINNLNTNISLNTVDVQFDNGDYSSLTVQSAKGLLLEPGTYRVIYYDGYQPTNGSDRATLYACEYISNVWKKLYTSIPLVRGIGAQGNWYGHYREAVIVPDIYEYYFTLTETTAVVLHTIDTKGWTDTYGSWNSTSEQNLWNTHFKPQYRNYGYANSDDHWAYKAWQGESYHKIKIEKIEPTVPYQYPLKSEYVDEKEYPPSRTLTGNTTTISGQSYGNGQYIVSQSSTHDTTRIGYTAFNTGYDTGVHFAASKYISSTGVYNGSDYIVSGYTGDWLKIKLPVKINLSRYKFKQRFGQYGDYYERAPGDFKIYGSNDDIIWAVLVSNVITTSNYVSGYYEQQVSTEGEYQYLVLVVNKLAGPQSILNFDEWYIYGRESSIVPYENNPIDLASFYEVKRKILVEYPTYAMTANTYYGYDTAASSVYSTSWDKWEAFNKVIGGEGWHCAHPRYNTSGNYTGSASLTDVNGTVHYGEWIYLKLTYEKAFEYCLVYTRSGYSYRGPKSGVIMGSNTATNGSWVLLTSFEGKGYFDNNGTKIEIKAKESYIYYVLLTKTIKANSNSYTVNISEIKYIAYDDYDDYKNFKTFEEFPPTAMTSNNSGGYIASASSVYSTSWEVWEAFNKIIGNDGWCNQGALYNAGNYTSGSSLTDTNGTIHQGEWIKLQLPTAKAFEYCIIYPHNSYLDLLPESGVILASNSGANGSWVLLRSFDSKSYYQNSGTRIEISSQHTYLYYTILTKTVTGGQYVTISEIKYYAHKEEYEEYPKVAMTSHNSGGYIASATSVYSSWYAWKAFNDVITDNDNQWHSGLNYNSNGAYTGSSSLTDINGTVHSGDYITLQLPTAKMFVYCLIYQRPNALLRGIKTGVVLASNSGTNGTWELLSNFEESTYTAYLAKRIEIHAQKPYLYYTILGKTLLGPNSINISEIKYYAKKEDVYEYPQYGLGSHVDKGYYLFQSTYYNHAHGNSKAFDRVDSTSWISQDGTYHSNTGVYNNTRGLTDITGVKHFGEYIGIRCLSKTNMKYVLISCHLSEKNGPINGVILATNTGTGYFGTDGSWVVVANFMNQAYSTSIGNRIDIETNNIEYRYYVIVITKVLRCPKINEIRFFATNPTINKDGLQMYIDPMDLTCYSGSGSTMYNIMNTSENATLAGSYSNDVTVNPNGYRTIRLSNTSSTRTSNVSRLQINKTITNITTISMWIKIHSIPSDAWYLLDSRTGMANGWIKNGGAGSDWSSGKLYKNGGSQQSVSWDVMIGSGTVGVWQNITLVANNPGTDSMTIFARYSNNEGLNVTFGPIMIYNREITEQENRDNYNYYCEMFGLDNI